MTKTFLASTFIYVVTFALAGLMLLLCSLISTDRLFAHDYEPEAEAFCQVYNPDGWTFDVTQVDISGLYGQLGENAGNAIYSSELKAVFADYLETDPGTDMAAFVERGFSRVMQKPWKCDAMREFEASVTTPIMQQSRKHGQQGILKVNVDQHGVTINNQLLVNPTQDTIGKTLGEALDNALQPNDLLAATIEQNKADIATDLMVIDIHQENDALVEQLLAEAGKLGVQRINLVEH